MVNKFLPTIVAVIADLAGLGLFLLLLPFFTEQFSALKFLNSLWMGLFFFLFCVAVFYLQKLKPLGNAPRPVWLTGFLANRPLLVGLAVVMAFIAALATAYLVGFLDSVANITRGILDEPAATIYLLLPPASWFGLALVYVLVLSAPTEANIDPARRRYTIVSFLSLMGINLLAVVLTVVASVTYHRFFPAGNVLWTGIFWVFWLLLLFLPPRFIHLAKINQPLSIPSFILFLCIITFYPL